MTYETYHSDSRRVSPQEPEEIHRSCEYSAMLGTEADLRNDGLTVVDDPQRRCCYLLDRKGRNLEADFDDEECA